MRSGPATQHSVEGVRRSTNVLDARIPVPRAGYHGSIPAWPSTLIDPVERELVRWIELWGCPQAAVWAQTAQEHAVATLVRLEQRCAQVRVSADCVTELRHLRHELGLTQDAIERAERDV